MSRGLRALEFAIGVLERDQQRNVASYVGAVELFREGRTDGWVVRELARHVNRTRAHLVELRGLRAALLVPVAA